MSITPLHPKQEAPVPPMPRVGNVSEHPQRARLGLRYYEQGMLVECAEDGWAAIAGSWVMWLSEAEGDQPWQSFPIQNVNWIQWEATSRPVPVRGGVAS